MIEEKTLKKILLSLFGIIAMIGCLAIASDAFALTVRPIDRDILENTYEGDVTAAYCAGGGSSFTVHDLYGQLALVPPDPASGMGLDFAANAFEKDHGFITPVGYMAEGGDASAYSRALQPS